MSLIGDISLDCAREVRARGFEVAGLCLREDFEGFSAGCCGWSLGWVAFIRKLFSLPRRDLGACC